MGTSESRLESLLSQAELFGQTVDDTEWHVGRIYRVVRPCDLRFESYDCSTIVGTLQPKDQILLLKIETKVTKDLDNNGEETIETWGLADASIPFDIGWVRLYSPDNHFQSDSTLPLGEYVPPPGYGAIKRESLAISWTVGPYIICSQATLRAGTHLDSEFERELLPGDKFKMTEFGTGTDNNGRMRLRARVITSKGESGWISPQTRIGDRLAERDLGGSIVGQIYDMSMLGKTDVLEKRGREIRFWPQQ